MFIGGFLVDGLIARGYSAPKVRRAVLVGGTVCGLGIACAISAHSAVSALIPISLAIGGLSAASPVLWSMPSLLVPNSSTGKVGGIMNFSNQISAIAAPIITGITVGRTGGYTVAFSIAAAYLGIGILAYVFLLGRIEPLEMARRA